MITHLIVQAYFKHIVLFPTDKCHLKSRSTMREENAEHLYSFVSFKIQKLIIKNTGISSYSSNYKHFILISISACRHTETNMF